ncbi:MAG TPA: hypothetical protein VKB38_24815 [Terracidiphilus sp.]|nr:hypothetical protein [Terracidiphilus sp.]
MNWQPNGRFPPLAPTQCRHPEQSLLSFIEQAQPKDLHFRMLIPDWKKDGYDRRKLLGRNAP